MHAMERSLTLAAALWIVASGCAEKEKEQVAEQQDSARGQVAATTPTPPPDSQPLPTPPPPAGFDITKVAVVNPQLGEFPYFSLIEGYLKDVTKFISEPDGNKQAAFDKYEFFDGVKLIPIEGRLETIEAEGKGASAFQVLKTYEALVTRLGGVKVYEGSPGPMKQRGLEYAEERHRDPVYDEDQMGVYALRLPDREVWVEAYVSSWQLKKDRYYLTVVERKPLEVMATLLPAAEMKKELDTKGHVALYINFDFDKSDIKPESQPIVAEIVKLLRENPDLKLTVEGHTDNVGEPNYNKRLSDARASAVVAALEAQGIQDARLTSQGFGQEKPIADNTTDDGRAKNRRVELVKIE